MKTRSEIATQLLADIAKGPALWTTFAGATPPLTAQQSKAIEKKMRETYQIWASTWITPNIETLLACDMEKTTPVTATLLSNQKIIDLAFRIVGWVKVGRAVAEMSEAVNLTFPAIQQPRS